MSTPNILMTRIDERLVHGQGQLWVKSIGANTVIVANDETANVTNINENCCAKGNRNAFLSCTESH